MPENKKGRPEGRPIPNAVVYHDSPELKTSEAETQAEFAQDLARSVFGRAYVVIRAPVPKRNPRIKGPVPSRIRSWRNPR